MNGQSRQAQPPQVQAINVGRQGPIILEDIIFANGQMMRIPMPVAGAVSLAGRFIANAVDAAQDTAMEYAKTKVCPDCQVKLSREQAAMAETRAKMVAAHQAGIQPPDEAPPAEETELPEGEGGGAP